MAVKAIDRLRGGEAVFGLSQTYPDAAISELAAWSGFDFVVLDCEHGVVDETAQLNCLRALSGTDAFCVVRVRSEDKSAVARYLDHGVDAIMVPDVRTRTQATDIAGVRGRWTKGLRTHRYGLTSEGRSVAPLLIAMIESREGAENAESILSLEGIDGVVIGAGDLSASLGTPGQFSTQGYNQAVAEIESAARNHRKILGAKPGDGATLAELIVRGHRFLMIARDVGLYKKAFSEAIAAAKGEIAGAET